MAVSVLLLASSCGGDDDGDSAGEPTTEPSSTESPSTDSTSSVPPSEPEQASSTTDAQVEFTASYRGVAEDTINIGVVLFDLDAILDLGVDVGYGDQQAHYDVAIEALNNTGGILGRKVEPSYKFISPVSPEEAEAACTELTQDEEVFLVLGTQRPAENVWCYTQRGDTPFIGALQTVTDATFSESVVPVIHQGKAPARTDEAIVTAMEDADAVAGEVVAIHGRDQARIDALAAALVDAGAQGVVKTVATAPELDQVALAAELDVFVERFRTEGATQAINLGDNVAYLAAFNRVAYAVPVWTTSVDVLSDIYDDHGATDAELRLVNLVGGAVDIYAGGHEPTVECVDRWNELRPDEVALPDPGDDDLTNIGVVISACFQVELLELVATAAGPDLTVESFTAALDDIGEVDIAGMPIGSVSSTKWDVSDAVSVRSYDESTGSLDTVVILQAG